MTNFLKHIKFNFGRYCGIVSLLLILCIIQSCDTSIEDSAWETVVATGEPTARHEAGFVAYKDQLLLIGGRRINPTDVFDTKTSTWTAKKPPPIELHHFQPVVLDDAVYLIGAMTGQWPDEKPLDSVMVYYPKQDTYITTHKIPAHRKRGGAGTVVYKGKIYIIGGIVNGHMDGYVPWLDEYDPKTGVWKVLDDAPDARDHFQAAMVGDRIYAFAGRRTSKRTDQDMALTSTYGNVYNFKTSSWEPVTDQLAIPTQRAGNAAFAYNNEIIIGGGESLAHEVAHNEVEAYDARKGTWRNWPNLKEGRHGSGFAVVGDYVYIASGSGNRGGGPELTTIERLQLPTKKDEAVTQLASGTPVYKQWHTVTLDFQGPETSETASDNPFLNYRLEVDFKHKDTQTTVCGFYAADGNAGETSAEAGNVWRARFNAPQLGEWTYEARLYHGDRIALRENGIGETLPLQNNSGSFVVSTSDKTGEDFRESGRLQAAKGYYKFQDSNDYWLKAGTNSPENLLGYVDFDGTYRMQASAREGEASTTEEIHTYKAHLKDWNTGDPTWKGGKGKGLIGALNYLSSKGMNASYFLTMNILGDGKDVWPYHSPDDFTRFDVSKLAQWEIVFQHMQAKGMMLHMVLQETENETMLDQGDTGAMRRLYLNELIARFGHHLALTWNLGEENGPASWSPVGQNDRQRKAMAQYIKETDPYNHPVVLHTHSHDPLRKEILDSIIGFKYVDGLSLQQDKREFAPEVVAYWKQKSKEEGHEWLITMDEIGMWHTAALPDNEDPNHDTLRAYALWGTLLSGGAGVEWYFGAKHPHNDLTSEDWRQRDRLWELTNHAKLFFENHLPYWDMEPTHRLIEIPESYCLSKPGEVYAVYLPRTHEATLDLTAVDGKFTVQWYDPLEGRILQEGSVKFIQGGGKRNLGKPPRSTMNQDKKDWVCLVKKIVKQTSQ